MIKKELKCFYTISEFKEHTNLKAQVLDSIKVADAEHIVAPAGEVDISRSDWHKANDTTRFWANLIVPKLMLHMEQVYSELGYNMFHLREFWFQQYNQGSGHGWHIHGANFTNVYYLDLPKGASRTQLVVPFDQKEIIEVDVKEGDVVTFPSFVIHRGPPNQGPQKTIISYNIDIDYPDSQYGKGLK